MINIKGICYIAGASFDDNVINFSANENDFVIAADGGYDLLQKSGIGYDVLLGDFDSIESVPADDNIIKHPVEKDDTDSFLAYKLGYEKGYRSFVVFGGIGGRFDHTMANTQMLCHMAKNGARGFLVGENTIITAIHNSKIIMHPGNTGKIGVFAHGNTAKCVNISGLKYTMSDGELTSDFPLGVSNEFIGETTEISVSDGTLLIIWYEPVEKFLNNIDTYLEV